MSDEKDDLIKHLEDVQDRYSEIYDAMAETATTLLGKAQDKNGKVRGEDLAALFIATRRLSDSFEALIPADLMTVYNAVLQKIREDVEEMKVEPPDELKAFEEAQPPKKEWLN
jgi:hypothetical protein